MAKVKCVVTIPDGIDEISTAKIDGVNVPKKIKDGQLVIKRDDAVTFDGLNVTIVFHGTVGLKVEMDIFINDTKFNKNPIEAVYMPHGHYVINYNA